MKFCTQFPRICAHKRFVLDFNIRYLPDLQFLRKMAHNEHAQEHTEHK